MPEIVYVLRTCDKNLRAYGDFQWPESGPVEAPDWQPRATCGNGLHGLLWGAGDASHLATDADAKWLVVAVVATEIVDLDGKVKFPRGEVVFCGERHYAVADIINRGAKPEACNYSTLTGGNYSTLTGGEGSTLTGGNYSTLTGGEVSTLTGGYGSTLIFKWWDDTKNKYRATVAEVGENGIEKDKPYFVRNGVVVERK